MQLLQPPRNRDRPASVAEVPLQLPDDGREDVRHQLHFAIEIEALDRLDQSDVRDLLEVVDLLAAPRVAIGDATNDRDEALDQPVAGSEVALLAVGAQERATIRLCDGGGALQTPGTTSAGLLF